MSKEIPSLTGLRGVAALIVFFFHAGLKFLTAGFGVALFFFLSGYLITTLLCAEQSHESSINFKRFYARRAWRILPPMYLVLGITLLICAEQSHAVNSSVAWLQAFHLTNYVLATGGQAAIVPATGQMWSLSIEEHYYLLFPVALLILLRHFSRNGVALVFAGACAASLGWRYWLALHGVSGDYIHHATDTRIDSLLFGAILAVWHNPTSDVRFSRAVSYSALAVAGAVLVVAFSIHNRIFHDSVCYTLQSAALMPVFYCAVRFADSPLFAWLSSRPIRAMGLISYTFYLSHVGCLFVARHWWPAHPIHAGAVALAATLGFSTASYYLIERPLTSRLPARTVPIANGTLHMRSEKV